VEPGNRWREAAGAREDVVAQEIGSEAQEHSAPCRAEEEEKRATEPHREETRRRASLTSVIHVTARPASTE